MNEESSLLARLLRMADGYRRENAPRQAIHLYFQVMNEHPDSPEGKQAREWLLEIGEQYERNGELRQARSLYEQLL